MKYTLIMHRVSGNCYKASLQNPTFIDESGAGERGLFRVSFHIEESAELFGSDDHVSIYQNTALFVGLHDGSGFVGSDHGIDRPPVVGSANVRRKRQDLIVF